MPPDAARMLADVPGALRREAKDAGGAWHDAVLAPESIRPQAGEYGIERFPGGSLFVAAPFAVPDSRISLRDCSGNETARRILSVADNAWFLEIGLGEEA